MLKEDNSIRKRAEKSKYSLENLNLKIKLSKNLQKKECSVVFHVHNLSLILYQFFLRKD